MRASRRARLAPAAHARPRIVALSRSEEKRYAQIKLRTRKPKTLAGGEPRAPLRRRTGSRRPTMNMNYVQDTLRSAVGLGHGMNGEDEHDSLVKGTYPAAASSSGACSGARCAARAPAAARSAATAARAARSVARSAARSVAPTTSTASPSSCRAAQRTKKLSLDATCPSRTVPPLARYEINTPLCKTYSSPRVHLAEVKSL